ncbi:hypothetical protein ALC62_10182 [Cyphomyrmex costatus]|uniref:Uncharacterized protein n=1 Tax=Cyphomyrmex costatus TaxID=456900 RepID=A0A195CG39_9HYME|nr:hypothetical protein ALC62_10182 [Cyphomyrmex costatus]
MLFALFCVLLIGHHVQAVVNKAISQVPLTKEEEKSKVKAEDRIISTFDSLLNEYGPPLGSGFKGPAPVYGPPELVGNLGPTPIYPPPPPDMPPPISFDSLAISYGPPRHIKSQYGLPKQSFGLATSLLSKPIYGPPKLHYGLPKQHFTPPLISFPPFRSPKPQYGPPLKLIATSSQQYIPPKPGHGPPIPISLETYGPPPSKLAVQFNPLPNDEYGPPPPPVSVPQPQYGPPASDLYGPPPPAPPPGVPAPPTPPDIKYDGWQPIAGSATAPNQSGPPTDTYGPPLDAKHNHAESSSGPQLSHASLSASMNANVPSDSYGVPLQNPEDQNLKTSVHESSASSESNGLPPPPLPQNEPLHNNQGPGVTTTSQSDHQFGRQQLNLQYGAPNIEPLSIVKTVGFELLPTTAALNSDVSVNTNSAPLPSGLELTANSGGSHIDALSGGGGSHGFQNIGNDLSLQQLPQQTPLNDYGPPLTTATFGKPDGISGVSLLSPPPLNSYGAPPLSSYSPNEPIKFRESIPTELLSNINRYLPPSAKQQLPNLHLPVSFRHTSGPSNLFSGSFGSSGSFNVHNLNSPIAAPHAQYGTPLSFNDFNTPAPHLTYGAPNFGPSTSFVSTSSGFGSNLYNGISNALTTYGTPVVNAPLSIGGSHDCNSLQPLLPVNGVYSSRGPSATGELPLSGPPVSTLDLEHNEQPKINLKDSYGNPIGLTYDSSNEASDAKAVQTSIADVSNELSTHLPTRLTAQSFNQEKIIGSNEVDASQFLKSSEGSEALSLAQKLTADNADGFEIHGSKGTYKLQIQAADGGLGTANSDGSIRHDQVLSNGLLQDILAAIEQPIEENRVAQFQGLSQAQQLNKVYGADLLQETGVTDHFITVDNQSQNSGLQDRVEKVSDTDEDRNLNNQSSVALFFDTKYGQVKKEIRSASKNETQAIKENEQNNNKTKSS